MFRLKLMKNYKWIMGVLIILGVSLILFSRLELEGINSEYTLGMGVGLILAASVNLVILWFRFRNSDYKEALEIEMNDERVKMNKMKALAYAGVVSIASLCIMSMLNAYIEFSMVTGNAIVLMIYAFTLAFFKWILRNR